MVKIIRQGTHPDKKVLKTECKRCTTVFEFECGEAVDKEPFPGDPRDLRDRGGAHYYIQCPYCQTMCKQVGYN